MTTQRTTVNGVNDALSTLQNLIRLDTETVVGDLDLLIRVNDTATARYKAMADAAEGLQTDSEYLKGKYSEVNRYMKQVDDLEGRTEDLEKIVKELEEWTGELEIKARRFASKK